MNTNKEVEWRRFIVPKKVEQINDHLLMTNRVTNIITGILTNHRAQMLLRLYRNSKQKRTNNNHISV